MTSTGGVTYHEPSSIGGICSPPRKVIFPPGFIWISHHLIKMIPEDNLITVTSMPSLKITTANYVIDMKVTNSTLTA